MGEDTHKIEQEIRERRTDLGRNLDTLERKARELADWKTHYREHPGAFLGAAIGAGLMLGMLAVPRPRRRAEASVNAFVDAERDSSHDVYPVNGFRGAEPRHGIRADAVDRIRREASETWNHIATGLLRLASAKAIQFVSEKVPGFTEHVDEGHRQGERTLH